MPMDILHELTRGMLAQMTKAITPEMWALLDTGHYKINWTQEVEETPTGRILKLSAQLERIVYFDED